MKRTIKASLFIFVILTAGYVGKGNAGEPTNIDVPIRIVRSCERQDDMACVTKKFEQALLESNSMSIEDKLIVRYELAARYEYYEGDLNKACSMYLEIEKIDPDYGITQLSIRRLNRQISGLANR